MEKIVKGLFMAVLLLLFGSFNSFAGAPDTLRLVNLDSTITYALKNNPTQSVYQLQVIQSNLNLKAAKSIIFPRITGSINGQDNIHLPVTPIPGELIGKPGTTYYAQFGKKYAYNSGITLEKDLFDWQNFFTAKIAEGNYKLGKAQQDSYTQDLREQVAKLYFSLLVARHALETARNDEAVADSVASLAKQKLDEGNTDAITYNIALINLNIVRQNLAQSRQLCDQDIENLKIILGASAGTELIIEQHLDTNHLPAFKNINLLADKSLEAYRQQFETAGIQVKVQRSIFLPKLTLITFFGAQQYRNDFGLSLNNRAWSSERFIGLNLSVPIFTGFNTLNKYKSAIVAQSITKVQYEAAVNKSAINDRLTIKENADLTASVSASEQNYRLYAQIVCFNRQKFTSGLISLDSYLKAFQDYLTAENTLLTNLSQLYANQATILSRQ